MLSKLMPLLPDAKIFVDMFGGSGAVMLSYQATTVKVFNDLNSHVVNFYRVLRDRKKIDELVRLASLTPFSREQYWECVYSLKEGTDVERAWKFFVIARFSFGANFGKGFGTNVKRTRRGMPGIVSSYLGAIDRLPGICEELQTVQIENADFRTVIERYDGDDVLFYCDPYLQSTRRDGWYEHEMTDGDHRDLCRLLNRAKGAVVLSGYDNWIYEKELSGFSKVTLDVVCHLAGRTKASGLQGEGAVKQKQRRAECVWRNEKAVDFVR